MTNRSMNFALAGNQNSGKTTLFNRLTGSNQRVGNFPGVTVEQKTGQVKNHPSLTIVDLPGIYSLSPYSAEEIVTRDFLLNNKPDCVVNVVDATNIERNLYLSLQIAELGLPIVVALNMMDEVAANGGTIHMDKLSAGLGVPVVPISASLGKGIDELVDVALQTAEEKHLPERIDFCRGALHRAIHSTVHMIEDHAMKAGMPPRFAATKLIEGDDIIQKKLRLSRNEEDMIRHTVSELEQELGTQSDAALADMRYAFIERVCAECVQKPLFSREHQRSVQLDRILTHKVFAIPIFLVILFTIFWLTFNVIGSFLSDVLSMCVEGVSMYVDGLLAAMSINSVLHRLVIDGIFAGVGSVLSFLPIIIVLFFFLSILEDTGYMARVAFIMDMALRKFGLSGRSFVPMIMGFGCTVPAIMATRTLSSERDRKMTIFLTPFMSCSAKVPIYAVFTAAFFPNYAAVVMIGLYVFGILTGVLFALCMKAALYKGDPVPFVMELPPYRLPSLKSVGLLMWQKAEDFLSRAFTVILIATVVIWALGAFDTHFNYTANSGDSILAAIGSVFSVALAPVGLNDWRMSTALITGFMAKEAVVSTLTVLTGATSQTLTAALWSIFTPLSALSFLVFTLLYTPCVAAVAAARRELQSGMKALLMVVLQTAVAYAAAFLVYQFGGFLIKFIS